MITSSPGLSRRSPSFEEESADGEEIGGRSGVDQRCAADSNASERSNSSAAAGGKPAIERRINHRTQIGAVNATRDRHRRLARFELGRREGLGEILGGKIEDLLPKMFCFVRHRQLVTQAYTESESGGVRYWLTNTICNLTLQLICRIERLRKGC